MKIKSITMAAIAAFFMLSLTGCASYVQVTYTDPVSGAVTSYYSNKDIKAELRRPDGTVIVLDSRASNVVDQQAGLIDKLLSIVPGLPK